METINAKFLKNDAVSGSVEQEVVEIKEIKVTFPYL